MGDFNSYLADEIELVDKFRSAMKLVQTLSSHRPAEVFNSDTFNHCHVISGDKSQKVIVLLTSKLGVSEQLIEGETIMQVGLDGDFRMVGMHTDGVFCVYLVDYSHSLGSVADVGVSRISEAPPKAARANGSSGPERFGPSPRMHSS